MSKQLLRKWLAIVLLGASGVLSAQAAPAANNTGNQSEDPVLALGRACAADFHTGQTAALWARMTTDMRKAFGNEQGLTSFQKKAGQDLGQETAVISETSKLVQGFRSYTRIANFSGVPIAMALHCVFDEQNLIVGFLLQASTNTPKSPATSAYLDYQTQAALQLPFTGEWLVVWGGRTIEQNYHVVSRDQRFAYDFVIASAGKTHTGDGQKKEQYFCWNQAILAPADGTVVVAEDGLTDNEPGDTDAAHPPGNHVMLDFGNQEYALLGHLRQGSVKVKLGEAVKAGQELGRCGNSGNTSEPHLHFHLQNAKGFGTGEGLPAFFNHYLANGNRVTRGEPLREQIISATPDN